jgi:voltage-gated potassium channel
LREWLSIAGACRRLGVELCAEWKMDLVYDFIRLFLVVLMYAAPLLLSFLALIVVLGLVIGKREGWSSLDAVYFAFVSATTVGFGDLHPTERLSKLLSIVIAMLGLIFTGIVIAVALSAASHAFKSSPAYREATRAIEQIDSAPHEAP